MPSGVISRTTYPLLAAVSFTVAAFNISAWHTLPTDGSSWETHHDTVIVAHVAPGTGAEVAGLRSGDMIVNTGGHRAASDFFIQSTGRYFPVGTLVDYEIVRNGQLLLIPVTLQSVWSTNPELFTVNYALIFLILALGLVVLFLKGDQPEARRYFLFTQCFAVALNASPTGWNGQGLVLSILLFCGLAFQGPALFHFVLLFPRRHPLLDRHPKLPLGLYVAAACVVLLAASAMISWTLTIGAGGQYLAKAAFAAGCVWTGATLLLALLMAVRRCSVERDFVGRNQLRWIMIGMVFGVVPGCIFGLIPTFAWRLQDQNNALFQFLLGIGSLCFVLFSLLALFRYRLWGVEDFIRRTLLYFILTGVIAGSYLLIGSLIDSYLPQHSETTHLISLVVATLLFLPLREGLQRSIDTLFHRELYSPTHAIERFEEALVGIVEEERLAAEIIRQIDGLFHFTSLLVLIKNEKGGYRVFAEQPTKSVDLTLLTELLDRHAVLLSRGGRLSAWDMSADESLTSLLGASLLVPLNLGAELAGILACGTKISGRPTSRLDVDVLTVLAQRSASFLRTARLYRRDQESRELYARELLQSQEHERRRVAGELHDGLGQYFLVILSRAKMLLRDTLPEPMKTDVSEIVVAATQGIDDVRETAYNLSPYHLDQVGLRSSVEAMMKRVLDASRIRWKLDAELMDRVIPREARIHVYRFIQECLNNAVKHANATSIEVRFEENGGSAKLRIIDDGIGFDPASIRQHHSKSTGFGLQGLGERVRLLNGDLSIDSAERKGSTITLTLPL